MSVTFWDTETRIGTLHGRKASPFFSENWVVAHAWAREGGPVAHRYYGKERPAAGWFTQVLEGATVLVGHNIKFDLLHMMQDPTNRAAFMRWVADGGEVWDTQLAEYLLQGQRAESFYLSLDDLSAQYGGDPKVDEVKILWEQGVNTDEIDQDLLLRYLCGGRDADGEMREGDIGNTRTIYRAQRLRAEQLGMIPVIRINMGALLATVEMEHNGLRVDMEHAEELRAKAVAELAAVQAELDEYVQGLPFEFKWTSRHHVSALIFGGTVSYEVREHKLGEDGRPLYSMKDETHYILEDGSTVECLWYEHAWQAEGRADTRVRFAGGKQAGEPKTKKVKVPDTSRPKMHNVEYHHTFRGYTAPDRAWETSTPGVYSTAAEVIEALGNREIPFLKALAKRAKLAKDIGTYYYTEPDAAGVRKGMLTLVGDDGLIHHNLNMTSTVTGRFSCSNPNLQNIPKGNKSAVKEVFVSRFAGGKVIQSDFSSLEVYVQANLTKCAQLIKDLLAGRDMHCVRLAAKEHMTYEEVFDLCKVQCIPEWDYKRTGAKQFSFQRAYGAGAPAIAESTGMSLEEVEALIEAEERVFPEISEYFNARALEIQKSRVPTTIFIQHPQVPGLTVQLGRGECRAPSGTRYTYMESPSPVGMARRGQGSSFSPTIIKNYEVQGEGALVCKAALWLAVRSFYALSNLGGQALLINTVHDAVYADASPIVAEAAAKVLHACMVGASEFLQRFTSWQLEVPVPSDTTWGSSMAEEEKITGLTNDAVQTLIPRVLARFPLEN